MPDSVKNNGRVIVASDAEDQEDKEMTVMCFFATDNTLSPLVISQLKSIKDAGYQENTDVIVRFDPSESSVPTRVYRVNHTRRANDERPKGKRTVIGDGRNPFVRNMAEDIIDADDFDPKNEQDAALKVELKGEERNSVESLQGFVDFCLKHHRAKRYMLFLVGHGMIVGNDAFLPDEHPQSGISLSELEGILKSFKQGEEKTKLELLGLHSCSMSSVEIAYQLKGLANYMIASQGTSYVGSWPYRQLLKKIFATVDDAKGVELDDLDIQTLVEKLYYLSLYNTTDFMLAGYSSDMTLCNLQEDVVQGLTTPLQNLIDLLTNALSKDEADPVRNLVVSLVGRAHSESQSYWGETYTDLYDFCDRLREACLKVDTANANPALQDIVDACDQIIGIDEVISEDPSPFKKVAVRSEYFGWKFQYSHGLSIYFPWSEPLEVEDVPTAGIAAQAPQANAPAVQRSAMDRYRDYKFNAELRDGSRWCDFLKSYFDATQRRLRNGKVPQEVLDLLQTSQAELDRARKQVVSALGDGPAPPDHKVGSEIGASDCSCPSIKNFFTEPGRRGRKIRGFSISPGALLALRTAEPEPEPEIAAAVGRRGD